MCNGSIFNDRLLTYLFICISPDCHLNCRELNNKLVPVMLDRLHMLHKQACAEKIQDIPSTTNSPSINFTRPFAHLAKDGKENAGNFPN